MNSAGSSVRGQGIKREMDTIRWRNDVYSATNVTEAFSRLMSIQQRLDKITEVPEEEDMFRELYRNQDFIDDVHGTPLDKEMAIKARQVEIQYFKVMQVYTKVTREAWMNVISTKWIDTNKGDIDNPNYRARLVGREIAREKRDDLFAATPPLESLRFIVSKCSSNQYHANSEDRHIIMSNDIKRAYFYAPSTRPVYIAIPREDQEPGDEDKVGVLNLSLYGTRDAAMNWTKTTSCP